MLTGWPPFIGKNRQMIFNRILSFDIEFDPIDKISDQAQDIIRKLLTKKPEERRQFCTFKKLKTHGFFKDIK
jgi:serine/threonine protein kinase